MGLFLWKPIGELTPGPSLLRKRGENSSAGGYPLFVTKASLRWPFSLSFAKEKETKRVSSPCFTRLSTSPTVDTTAKKFRISTSNQEFKNAKHQVDAG
jgi:hypothetical protein